MRQTDTERSEALEQEGAERPDVLVLPKTTANSNSSLTQLISSPNAMLGPVYTFSVSLEPDDYELDTIEHKVKVNFI